MWSEGNCWRGALQFPPPPPPSYPEWCVEIDGRQPWEAHEAVSQYSNMEQHSAITVTLHCDHTHPPTHHVRPITSHNDVVFPTNHFTWSSDIFFVAYP